MILDERTEFVDGVAIPTSAGTDAIGDVIDLQGLGGSGIGGLRDAGNGQPAYWYVSVDAAGTGGTSLNVQLVSSDSEDLSSPVVHAQTGVVALANLKAGALLTQMSLPVEGSEYKRYLGIQAVVVGTFTGGKFSSGLSLDPKGWKAYPEGDN